MAEELLKESWKSSRWPSVSFDYFKVLMNQFLIIWSKRRTQEVALHSEMSLWRRAETFDEEISRGERVRGLPNPQSEWSRRPLPLLLLLKEFVKCANERFVQWALLSHGFVQSSQCVAIDDTKTYKYFLLSKLWPFEASVCNVFKYNNHCLCKWLAISIVSLYRQTTNACPSHPSIQFPTKSFCNHRYNRMSV